MTQHTAGPYQVAQYAEQLAIYAANLNYADNVKVATIETWIGDTERAESEANARLLAAAPFLLECLKELVAELDNPDLHDPTETGGMLLARQAIAQAEGGTSHATI